ncbi:MAG: putative anti-sigma factor [Mucilaginibacter sp.]|nr:putative anti-sigma factor [Mucilaginibacter sp.]
MPDSYNSERVAYLARKWQDGNITPDEKLEFDQWYDEMDNDDTDHISNDVIKERIYQSILRKEQIKSIHNLKAFQAKRVLIALSAFLLLFFPAKYK